KGEVAERKSAHEKIISELEPLIKKMQDPTLSEAVRKRHQAAAQAKDAERKSLDTEMAEYSERRRRQLVEQVEGSKADLLNEISVKVNEIAAADGYDAVFDRSGLSERGFPFVVFVKDATDLSEKVIKNLNANAPKVAAPKSE
ncbi:MAG: Skp family chaperone for outer membrane protein, partial [Verrucomicrobiales bacterium]